MKEFKRYLEFCKKNNLSASDFSSLEKFYKGN